MASFAEDAKTFRIERGQEAVERQITGQEPEKTFADSVREAEALRAAEQPGLGPEIVGPQGPTLDAATRAKLSVLGDDFGERQRAFLRLFPKGNFVSEPGTGREVFRKTQDEPFGLVDPNIQESFQRGEAVAEFGRDVADIAGEGFSVVGETIGFLLRRRGGAPSRAAGSGVGGAAGEGVRQELQTLSGTQIDSLQAQADDAIGAGLVGAAGSAGADLLGAGINVLRGRGAIVPTPEGRTAIRSAERLPGFPGLTAGQVSRQPVLQNIQRQSAQTIGSVSEYIGDQRRRLVSLTRGVSDPKERSRLIQRGAAEHKKASDQLISDILPQRVEFRSGGRALQQGVELWNKASGVEVDSLYNAARALSEPQFDLSNLKAIAQDIKEGTPLAREGGGTVNAASGLDAEVQSVADAIIAADPSLPSITLNSGRVSTAVDQLRALSQQVGDAAIIGIGGKPIKTAPAKRLYGAIQDTLDAPIGGDPAFVNAWKRARGEARRRFATREKLAIVKAAGSETPAKLAKELGRPGQIDNLALYKKIVPDKEFKKFQRAFRTNLIDEGNINIRLDSFDAPTLNVLMGSEEKRVFRALGRDLEKLESAGFKQTMAADDQVVPVLENIVSSNNPDAVAGLALLVTRAGGKDSPLGKSVRAGLANLVFQSVRRSTPRGEAVSGTALESIMRELGDKNLLRFFTKSEVQRLNDVRKVSPFVEQLTDAGVALQAASAASGALKEVLSADVSPFTGSIGTLIKNATAGRIFTSKFGQRLAGSGRAGQSELLNLRLLSLAASDIAVSDEQTEELGRSVRELTGVLAEGLVP